VSADPFPEEEIPTHVEARKSPHPKARAMQIALINHSTHRGINAAWLAKVASVLEDQTFQHFAPFWQSQGVRVTPAPNAQGLPADTVPMVILDDADQADALGYHSITPEGHVYGRAFVKPILSNGGTLHTGANSLSCTLSHEVLETIGDPYANFWADMPSGLEDAIELCDRVEADSYEIDHIAVSNFLGPRAFRDGPGPYDWLRLMTSPWEIRPGGYAIRRQGGPSGSYENAWGMLYPNWRKPGKGHPAARTARRLTMHKAAI